MKEREEEIGKEVYSKMADNTKDLISRHNIELAQALRESMEWREKAINFEAKANNLGN